MSDNDNTVIDNDYTKDIFDILGISGREDSYTDLIYSIFEVSNEFRENLLKYFQFNDDIDKLKMELRSCHFTPAGLRKKIIPDIIIYTENKIVIIEVKIFSGEGEKQLLRYDQGLDIIKGSLSISGEVKTDKYFLTLDKCNNENLGGGFNSITWNEFVKCIPDKTDNNIINICISDLKTRLEEYERYSKYEVDIKENQNFKEIYKWKHFVSYEKVLRQILKNELDDKKLAGWDIWEGWESAQNCYATTIQVYCDSSWISGDKILFDYIDGEFFVNNKEILNENNNYDIHYEIKIIGNSDIEFRIDYHTNPYLSSNEILGYELELLYEGRRKVLQRWKNKYKNTEDILSKAQGKALYIYKKRFKIPNDWTVLDFKNNIFNLIDNNNYKLMVDYLLRIIKER